MIYEVTYIFSIKYIGRGSGGRAVSGETLEAGSTVRMLFPMKRDYSAVILKCRAEI